MPLLIIAAASIIACTDPSVHDGDTIRCGAERVRLFGVDAPEVLRGQTPAEPFAYDARDELIRLTRGRVGCRFVERDRYGRFVGKCWSSVSSDVNAAVIRSGFATEYRRYSKGLYARAESEARSAGHGAWAGQAQAR
ncbi:nuclease [Caulobacter segnis]|uniref:Nuclease (SNase domain protein) n=2 Tax=Caulobacter segnis TaxID=88688 RepID=D5VG73_CAUST|nr:thermonuclease family protein [Caulobacter segnis]ADG10192.1 nuclease (SNase domain protein) [Caulobacter segnis ATCC 21756]AVQ01937.1 nuclease [Caulobacter segnis]